MENLYNGLGAGFMALGILGGFALLAWALSK